MTARRSRASDLEVVPLTSGRWRDLVTLFGPRGACGGCWCMWWRLERAEYERRKGDGNRRALRALLRRGEVPGLLGYAGGEPVAWCAVGPRAAFPALARSRILRPLDDTPVWSIVCLYVRRDQRARGRSVQLLRAAVSHARDCGAQAVEGYPVEPTRGRMPDLFAFTGLASAFRRAGFVERGRRSPTRPIMRAARRPARPRRPAR